MEDLLKVFEKEFGLSAKAKDIRIQEAFLELFGDSLKEGCRVSYAQRGVLKLATQDPSESFGLMMKKTHFITKVNEYLGENLLKDIRIENER